MATNVEDDGKSLTYLGMAYTLESSDKLALNDNSTSIRDLNKTLLDILKVLSQNNQSKDEYRSLTDFIKNNSQLFVVMGVFCTISVLFNAIIQNDTIKFFAIGTSVTLLLAISYIILNEWRKIKLTNEDMLKLTPTFFGKMVFLMSFFTLILLVASYLFSNPIMFGLIYLFIILIGSIVLIPAYFKIKEKISKLSRYNNITEVLNDPHLLQIILLILAEFYLILLLLLSFAYIFNFINIHNEWMNQFGIIALASIIVAGITSMLFVTLLWSGFMLGGLLASLIDKINDFKINTRTTKRILDDNFVGVFIISGVVIVIILLLIMVPGQIVIPGQQKITLDPIVGSWTTNITGINVTYTFYENNTFMVYNPNDALCVNGKWEKINSTNYLITVYIPSKEPLIGNNLTIILPTQNSSSIAMESNPETFFNYSTKFYYMNRSKNYVFS